ncbi:MAG: PilZ domain-containing protein, partial [Candidatus Eremiobacterota bacterium]
MLSFLTAIVELVDLRDGRLVFRSNRKYPVGKKVSVRVELPPASGQLVTLEIQVESFRAVESDISVYVSRIVGDVPDIAVAGQVGGAALRGAARHPMGVRAQSRQLPGYRALTVDISRTGLQLETHGPLERGTVLALVLEFDRHDLPPLRCEGEVMWCRPHGESRHRMGLRFTPASPEVEQQIRRVADFFERNAQ